MREHLPEYACELVGTAFMMAFGIGAVTLLWGAGSPVPPIPIERLRLLVTGTLFAGGATMVVYSPLGQRRGAHINPAVTLAFWRLGKIPTRDALAYVVAQTLGAIAGVAMVAALGGEIARSVQLGATLPGPGIHPLAAFAAEVAITFLLVFLIVVLVNKPKLAARTGLIAGSLVACLVAIEAPISGTSLNPARSAAPALLFPVYDHQWIYLLAPPLGAALAISAFRGRWGSRRSTVCAKLYHTEKYPCIFPDCGYRRVRAGEVVMRQDEPGDVAYVVDRGTFEVRRRAADGRDVVLAQLGRGAWIGEMSLLLREPRSATVVAVADGQLRRVSDEAFGRVLADHPDQAMILLRQLAERVRETSRRIAP